MNLLIPTTLRCKFIDQVYKVIPELHEKKLGKFFAQYVAYLAMQSNRHGTIITDSWISKKVRILCSLHPESISKKESKKDDTLVSQHSCNVKSLDADRNIYTDQGVH